MKKRKFDEGGFTDAEDKATGLATSGKEAPVGFFKRLMMGNIDDATSEAGQKFGAGRARLDRMPVAPERNKTINMEGLQAPVVNKPFVNLKNQPDEGDSNVGIASIPTGPSGYKRDTEGEAASELARESRRTTPTNAPVRRTNPSISASDKPMPPGPMGNTNPRDAEKGMSRGTRNTNIDMAEGPTYNGPRTGPEKKTSAPKAEIPTAGASKAPASTGEDTSGPSNIERILMATGVGAGAVGLGAGVKAYKAAQRAKELAKELDAAKQFSQPVAKEVVKDISKYTPKQELEAGESSIRGALTRKGIREKRSNAEAGVPKGNTFMEKTTSNKRGTSYEDGMKKGGAIKKYASGGSVSASRRGDGCAQRGKTRGMMR